MPERAHPSLSVLIPVWNGERHLAAAIDSVLAQRWEPLEIIVVDDGSTDGSATVAKGFGPQVRCLRRPHGGISAARNAALAEATGEFILHFDADDLLTPASIAVRMAAFGDDPSLEMVIGHVENFFSSELDDDARARFRLPDGPQAGHLPGASIVRIDVCHRIGPLAMTWDIGADMEWLLRAREAGVRTRLLPDVVLLRRIHGRNTNLVLKDHAGDRLRIIKASLDRRRAAEESRR